MSDLDRILVGSSDQMNNLRRNLIQVANTGPGFNVILIGATGTGKEVAARAIHQLSPSGKAKKPYEVLNCSGLNEQLFESFLFGYIRGAFTGANKESPGLLGKIDKNFTQAASEKAEFAGTLFLDELHDLPPITQGLLLRFLESGEYRRLGDMNIRHAKVRVIAALQPGKELRGRLRDDLYNRLAEVEISLPALNERPGDIREIATELLRNLKIEQPTPVCFFNEKSVKLDDDRIARVLNNVKFFADLVKHDWSRGNVRELRSVLKRAALLDDFSLPASGVSNNAGAHSVATDSVQITLPEDPGKLLTAHNVKAEYVQKVYDKLNNEGISDVEIRERLGITDARTLQKYLGKETDQQKTSARPRARAKGR